MNPWLFCAIFTLKVTNMGLSAPRNLFLIITDSQSTFVSSRSLADAWLQEWPEARDTGYEQGRLLFVTGT